MDPARPAATGCRSPDDFLWGVATAAYQVEGAVLEDGRGPSIWDVFSHAKGKTFEGHTGDVACDQYHRYESDLDLMQQLGVRAYRFSIAWPRVFPEGAGRANDAGLAFYDRLVDAMLARGIVPAATMYHWDLPQALEERGGWRVRETAAAFEPYARAIVRRLGDRVKLWFTLNEPWCAWVLGYGNGHHAPGAKEKGRVFRNVAHHLLLAHGAGVAAVREEAPGDARVGIVHNCAVALPFTESDGDIAASREYFRRENGWLLGPVLAGEYPRDQWRDLRGAVPDVQDGDRDQIARPTDFVGLNVYGAAGVLRADGVLHGFEADFPRTAMGWPITPAAVYWSLRHAKEIWNVPEMLITENGCACADDAPPEGGRINDFARVEFLRTHLDAVRRAIAEGLPVRGYFHWSFMDNFEWAFGYSKRFGLVHVDYATQKRTPKASAEWYARTIAAAGF